VLWYFAYGSNMVRSRLQRRVGPVRDAGCQPLSHYRHAFVKRGQDGTAKGAILRAPAQRVYGVVYELTETQLEALTPYEGGYARVEVIVQGQAMTSFEPLAEAIQHGLRPTERYVRYYLEGMIEHGFPSHYVREIQRQISTCFA